jgi:hypothetical protein
MHILSVNGPVVTVAGFGDLLAVVTHASDCLSSGEQVYLLCMLVVLNMLLHIWIFELEVFLFRYLR